MLGKELLWNNAQNTCTRVPLPRPCTHCTVDVQDTEVAETPRKAPHTCSPDLLSLPPPWLKTTTLSGTIRRRAGASLARDALRRQRRNPTGAEERTAQTRQSRGSGTGPARIRESVPSPHTTRHAHPAPCARVRRSHGLQNARFLAGLSGREARVLRMEGPRGWGFEVSGLWRSAAL